MEIQSIYTAMYPNAIHLPRDVLKDFFEILRPFTEDQSISNNKELWLAYIDDKHILYNKIIFQAYNQRLKDYIACYGITERSTLLNIQKYSELLPTSIVNKLDSAPAHTLYLLHAIVIAELLATKRQKDAYLQELLVTHVHNRWCVSATDGINAVWLAFIIYNKNFAPACAYCNHPVLVKRPNKKYCNNICSNNYHNKIKKEGTKCDLDWNFNSPSQTKSAQTELKDWFQRSAEEKNITQPQAMEDWCKENDINYKTLASWQKWESHEKCPIKPKQLIRIELAIKKHFKGVTLKCLWALLNVNDKNHTKKIVSQTLKNFLEADGLLIEFVWPTEQINTVGQNLKNANESLLNFWEHIKDFKKIEANPFTAEKSIKVLEQNIKLGEEVNNFLADMSKYNVTPHINWVSPIFNKEFDDKKILMICLSAIPNKRPDVRPHDLIVDELMFIKKRLV